MKLALYAYCLVANRGPGGKPKSDMVGALAEDHMNDVASNIGAILFMAIAQNTIAVGGYLENERCSVSSALF